MQTVALVFAFEMSLHFLNSVATPLCSYIDSVILQEHARCQAVPGSFVWVPRWAGLEAPQYKDAAAFPNAAKIHPSRKAQSS